MSDALSYHFWNNGIVIRHNEEYESIEGVDDGVIVHLKSGKKSKQIAYSMQMVEQETQIRWV